MHPSRRTNLAFQTARAPEAELQLAQLAGSEQAADQRLVQVEPAASPRRNRNRNPSRSRHSLAREVELPAAGLEDAVGPLRSLG